MQSILYIDLIERVNYSYEKEIITKLTSILPSLNHFDVDYQSESFLIDQAIRLMNDSEKCIIIIESDNQYATKVLPFAENLIKQPNHFLVFLDGENQWMERLCSGIDKNYIQRNLSLKDKLVQSELFLK